MRTDPQMTLIKMMFDSEPESLLGDKSASCKISLLRSERARGEKNLYQIRFIPQIIQERLAHENTELRWI